MDLARLILGVDTRGLRDGERDLNSFSRTAANVAGAVGAAFAAIGFAQFGRQSLQAAIDAQEMGSAFEVVFGDMAASVRSWAEETGNAMGRSTQEIMRGALAFQELFGQALQPAQAAELSKQFAVLTQDLASFKNLSNEVAQQKLFSGLVGEAEPLRAVGVFLSEAAVQAKAAEMGLSGVNDELTDQEKIVARAAIIQEQLAAASGDVERTSGSAANQIKTYNAAIEELQVAIGQKLLPTLTPLITQAANIVTSMAQMAQAFSMSTEGANQLWNIVTTLGGAWAAYRVTLLAVAGAQAAYTAAMVIGTRVIGAAQAATLGLNAALIANPYTAAAVAVGVLAGAFITLRNAQAEARAETDNLTRSLKASANAMSFDFALKRIEAEAALAKERKDLAILEAKNAQGTRQTRGGIEGANQQVSRDIEAAKERIRLLEQGTGEADKAYMQAARVSQAIGAVEVPVARTATAIGGLGKEFRATNVVMKETVDLAKEFRGLSVENSQFGLLGRMDAVRSASLGFDATLSDADFGLIGGFKGVADEFDATLGEMADNTKSQTVTIAESFAQMSRQITSSLQGLANSIRSGDFLGILGGVLDIFTSLGSAGVFGKSLQSRLNRPPSFDGGGFTGMGARTGGLDGKGGFLAMLHPRETVVDHTRGQGLGGGVHVTVTPSPYFDVTVDRRAAQMVPVAANAGAMQAQSLAARSARRRVRG